MPVFRDVEAALGAIDRVAGHELAAPRGVPALAHAASESAVDGYFGARGLLAAAGVPFAAARRTESADESGGGRCRAWLPRRSEALGVTHKSDAGGVVVGLEDEPALRAAVATMAGPEGYAVEELVPTDTGVELIVGCRCDVRFGPVLLVGLGGMSRSPKPSSSASTPAPCRRDG